MHYQTRCLSNRLRVGRALRGKGAVPVLAVGVAATALLVACGGGSSSAEPPPPADRPPSETTVASEPESR